MSAIVIMVSQGAIALGGVVWGFSSEVAGVSITLVIAGVTLVLSLWLAARSQLILQPRSALIRPDQLRNESTRL